MINAAVVPQLFEGTARYWDGSFVVFGRVDRGIEGWATREDDLSVGEGAPFIS